MKSSGKGKVRRSKKRSESKTFNIDGFDAKEQ